MRRAALYRQFCGYLCHLAWSARHGDRAYWVGYNADGTILATTSSDGTARLWNARDGAAMATLAGHESWVTIAAWGPESAYLVTGSIDDQVGTKSLRHRIDLAPLGEVVQ